MCNPEFDQEHYRQQVRTLTDDLRALLEDEHLAFLPLWRSRGPAKNRDPLKYLMRKNGTALTKVDKVATAFAMAEHPAVLDRLDLPVRLEELRQFISSE